MKKWLYMLTALVLSASLTVPAGALEYTIDAPDGGNFGKPTSIEVVHTADGGAAVNGDRSKNAALIPPAFGSATSNLLNSGKYLAPDPAPSGMAVTGAVINGASAAVVTPGSTVTVSPCSATNTPSIWDGNVALAAHNREANSYFGEIHALETGDTIKLTTKLGIRTYEVVSVAKVGETDRSDLAATTDNCITLYTCVRNESDQRWCVRAAEVK